MLEEISGEEYCRRLIKTEEKKKIDFLELGYNLTSVEEEGWYKPKWNSFPEYIKSFPRSQGYISKVMGIHKKFVVEYKLSKNVLGEVGFSNLCEILPFAINEVITGGLMEFAINNTRTELRKKLTEMRLSPVESTEQVASE